MRWQGRRQSSNIEDRRGSRLSRGVGLGGIGTIVLILFALYTGQDPTTRAAERRTDDGGRRRKPSRCPTRNPPAEAQLREFTGFVLADTEETWNAIFTSAGRQYVEPTLVLFSGAVESACGFAESAVGPFYCPGDQKVYIDLSFYEDLQQKLGAGGDFAQAYVIAHEVGHHVQTLLGISERNQAARQQASEVEANALSVRQELQADCFAGIWAHNADRSRQTARGR